MKDVVILGTARTPIGAFQGDLAGVGAPDLGARALGAAIDRSGIAPEAVEQAYMGCVLTAGVGQAPARQATLRAGCPQQITSRGTRTCKPSARSRVTAARPKTSLPAALSAGPTVD